MAGKNKGGVSKNARREGAAKLISKWDGEIRMHTIFENGRMRHYAKCEKSGNTARKPRDLM